MNAAEHIVEAYYRLCQNCFTLSDQKVDNGNNRQLDLLAYQIGSQAQFHIEIGVTHRERWCPTIDDLAPKFEKKFFGKPADRPGATDGRTDVERQKNYFDKIEAVYRKVGFDPLKVRRVWVCWILVENEGGSQRSIPYESTCLKRIFNIEILSFRDYVLEQLEHKVGTSNYDDSMLRMLGFLKQRQLQLRKAG
ncbi:MAG: hypothetical protein WD044_03100 [Dongiaceae bacterium]